MAAWNSADDPDSDGLDRFANHVVRLRTREAALEAALEAQDAELEARARRIQELEAELAARQARAREAELQARERRLRALQEAMENAERSLAAADVSGGLLQEARRLLDSTAAPRSEDQPDPRSAAQLYMILADARPCEMLKEALRNVRDLLVLTVHSWVHSRAPPGDRNAVLQAFEHAFGKPLDRELHSKMMNAFHKVAKDNADIFADIFLSKNQLAHAHIAPSEAVAEADRLPATPGPATRGPPTSPARTTSC